MPFHIGYIPSSNKGNRLVSFMLLIGYSSVNITAIAIGQKHTSISLPKVRKFLDSKKNESSNIIISPKLWLSSLNIVVEIVLLQT